MFKETKTNNKNFRQLAALFLAEVIRSRRTSISRAAEISNRVIECLRGTNSETEVLGLLNDLEKDFEEVVALKHALHFGKEESEIKIYERQIKEFAAELFKHDMVKSVVFLQDASDPTADIQKLCLKYPTFCSYVLDSQDRVAMQPAV